MQPFWQRFAPGAWNQFDKKRVIQKENSECQHQIIQERIVCRENDGDLQESNETEADDAKDARQKYQADHHQFGEDRDEGGSFVKTPRKLLRVPADPGRKRAVLVILVHGGKISPRRIAAKILGDAGLKID